MKPSDVKEYLNVLSDKILSFIPNFLFAVTG
jgi:hypothetical protein